MSNKSQIKHQFAELTNTSITTAGRYLDAANYDLSVALGTYFDKHQTSSPFSFSASSPKIDNRLLVLFKKYQDGKDPEIIDVDGTMAYLEDLDISPEDVRSLTLAYLLNSPKMGVFTKKSFVGIWQQYKIFDLKGMKNFIIKFHEALIHKGISSASGYVDLQGDDLSLQGMYNYAFGFLMEVENQRLLDIETAIEYWKLLIPIIITSYMVEITPIDEEDFITSVNERINQWYEFLIEEKSKKAITYDTWSMFYLFFKEVILDDPVNFKNYDEMAAWPSFMDEYIEFLYDKELLTPSSHT